MIEPKVRVRVLKDFKIDGVLQRAGQELLEVVLSAALAWAKHEVVELLDKVDDFLDEKPKKKGKTFEPKIHDEAFEPSKEE